MGCWFLTGNAIGNGDVWQNCESDAGDPPGVIDGQTYTQGQDPVPTPTAPELRDCQAGPSVSNGQPPPPMYSWTGGSGEGESATASSGLQQSGSSSADDGSQDDGEANGDASTTWVPVETCTPCAEGSEAGGGVTSAGASGGVASATASATGSTSTAGGELTMEQGVTQLSAANAIGIASTSTNAADTSAASEAGATTSAATSAAASGGSGSGGALVNTGDLLLDKRDEETTTSNGQCCFTTYTVSTIGVAATSGAGASGTKAASGAGASTTARGATSGASAGGSGATALTTASGNVLPSGSAYVSGANGSLHPSGGNLTVGNSSTNGTNSTGNDTSGAYGLVDIFPADGFLGMVTAWAGFILLGCTFGGWTLV